MLFLWGLFGLTRGCATPHWVLHNCSGPFCTTLGTRSSPCWRQARFWGQKCVQPYQFLLHPLNLLSSSHLFSYASFSCHLSSCIGILQPQVHPGGILLIWVFQFASLSCFIDVLLEVFCVWLLLYPAGTNFGRIFGVIFRSSVLSQFPSLEY